MKIYGAGAGGGRSQKGYFDVSASDATLRYDATPVETEYTLYRAPMRLRKPPRLGVHHYKTEGGKGPRMRRHASEPDPTHHLQSVR